MKKIMMVLIAVTFMATSAFAGEAPEFDVVGCDASNYFNDVANDLVIAGNVDGENNPINHYSDFTDDDIYFITYTVAGEQEYDGNGNLVDVVKEIPAELFWTNAGREKFDPCFTEASDKWPEGYKSYLTPADGGAIYEWNILLQMEPESDLNILIRDCVLKMNSFTPFGKVAYAGASQTGRYVMPWGQIFWLSASNPTITVKAYPGEYQERTDFVSPFILDGRTMPELETISLEEVPYTSKGVWEETIVAVMPEDGGMNMAGETTYNLKQGDMIQVTIEVLSTMNTVNINYGEDNVAVNYVGVYGTEFIADTQCP